MNDWFEAEQRVERAQQLSESQHWEEALAEIDVALSINPNNALWHAHRGGLLEELERWGEAADAYKASLDLEPGEADVTMAWGVALTQLGRFSAALEVFEELTKSHPDFEPGYCHRINIYTELGRHAQAEEMFYLAQELDDSCPHCFFSIGISLAARGQTDRAIYCWQRVLELEPDYVGVNRRIAQGYRSQGKTDQAREYFLCELRDDPGNTELLFELADLALESGDTATAAAKCAQILELDPSHIGSLFALGNIWLRRGHPGRALACFKRVEELTEDDVPLPGFNRRVGETLIALGRFSEARDRLVKAADQDPEGIEVRMMLGRCLLTMDKLDSASDAFRRVLALDAGNAPAHHLLAVCLLRSERPDSALEHCLCALRFQPDHVAAMATAIRSYLELARWREARSMLRRASRIEPNHAELQRIGKTLWRYRLAHLRDRVVALFRRVDR